MKKPIGPYSDDIDYGTPQYAKHPNSTIMVERTDTESIDYLQGCYELELCVRIKPQYEAQLSIILNINSIYISEPITEPDKIVITDTLGIERTTVTVPINVIQIPLKRVCT